MLSLQKIWEYNVLGIYNTRTDKQFADYFKFIEENVKYMEGDIAEFGVFRGSSIVALGLFLKELGSDKKIYGFDSFGGFPTYHQNDDLSKFKKLLLEGRITQAHWDDISKNIHYRELMTSGKVNAENISTSGNFSDCSFDFLKEKIAFLDLDNIILVKGDFKESLNNESNTPLMAALIDCDLYQGYKDCLPFIWKNLVPGGYIFLDEYYSLKFPGARIATDEFFADKKDKPQKHQQMLEDFERWFVRKIYGR